MSTTAQIAKNIRDLHTGKNWTWSTMKDNLEGITWQQATQKIEGFNTIAVLVYHINYYVEAAIKVLSGRPLDSSDKYAFACPPINSDEDWQKLLEKTWAEAETLAQLTEQLPDEKLAEIFVEEKYGTYFRNLIGILEHSHYHLGQIVILKKLIQGRGMRDEE